MNQRRPIMAGNGQSMEAKEDKVYVFRLLGSIYEKDVGEVEAHPTVLEIEVSAPSEKEAENMIGNSLRELTVAVHTLRRQREREAAEADARTRMEQTMGNTKEWKKSSNPNDARQRFYQNIWVEEGAEKQQQPVVRFNSPPTHGDISDSSLEKMRKLVRKLP